VFTSALWTAIRCESLRPLINGTILGNNMLFGAVIRYQCNVGFRLEGPKTRTCLADRTWSEYEPTCSGMLKPCPHCRRKVKLSQKTARQRRQSHFSARVSLFCDSVDRLLRLQVLLIFTRSKVFNSSSFYWRTPSVECCRTDDFWCQTSPSLAPSIRASIIPEFRG